jgi:hypothetical protein
MVFENPKWDFRTFNVYKIVLTHREQVNYGEQGKALRTRPVCAYPKVARYLGHGDPNVAASFTCVSPK